MTVEPKHKRLAAAVELVRRWRVAIPTAAIACGVGAAEIRIALDMDRDLRSAR